MDPSSFDEIPTSKGSKGQTKGKKNKQKEPKKDEGDKGFTFENIKKGEQYVKSMVREGSFLF